jgi:hypothetical protein
MWEGIVAGAAVAGLNGLGAWWTIHWTFDKSFQTFLKVFMGGILLRLVLVGAGTFLLLWYTSIHKIAFIGALIVTFVVFQIGEIVFLLRRLRKEKEAGDKKPDPGLSEVVDKPKN